MMRVCARMCVYRDPQTVNVCSLCRCRRLSLPLGSYNKPASQTTTVCDHNRVIVGVYAYTQGDVTDTNLIYVPTHNISHVLLFASLFNSYFLNKLK